MNTTGRSSRCTILVTSRCVVFRCRPTSPHPFDCWYLVFISILKPNPFVRIILTVSKYDILAHHGTTYRSRHSITQPQPSRAGTKGSLSTRLGCSLLLRGYRPTPRDTKGTKLKSSDSRKILRLSVTETKRKSQTHPPPASSTRRAHFVQPRHATPPYQQWHLQIP